MDTFDLYMAISHKLGWDDMLSHIAIPAIKQIVDNSRVSPEYLVTCEPNDIFGCLIGECTAEEAYYFISLRWEIEDEMFHGIPHNEAINEWYK